MKDEIKNKILDKQEKIRSDCDYGECKYVSVRNINKIFMENNEPDYKKIHEESIKFINQMIKEMEETSADNIHQQVEKDSCLAVVDAILTNMQEIEQKHLKKEE